MKDKARGSRRAFLWKESGRNKWLVLKESLKAEIEEDTRKLVSNSFKSLGAITKKALSPVCKEWGEGKEEGALGGKAR